MSTKQKFLKDITTKIATNKLTICLLLAITLSACSTLPAKTKSEDLDKNTERYTRQADIDCQIHAQSIANHAESTASSAQYLTAAKAMSSCVSNALKNSSYNHSKEQDDVIMKMMAITTLNFIKSGDVLTASREVDRFKRTYPNQDLYFEDYTSFLDTATALLTEEPLHSSQLSTLNISRVLRDEIERKHYWLNH
ncbi:MAG: hypothetical protein MJK15_06050 [Colwellia sp.]|nr:hypothetical protein [Colwellia sp.]